MAPVMKAIWDRLVTFFSALGFAVGVWFAVTLAGIALTIGGLFLYAQFAHEDSCHGPSCVQQNPPDNYGQLRDRP